MLIQFILIGLVLWLIDAYVPMAGPFKVVFRVFCLVVAIWFLFQLFGVAMPGDFRLTH